MGLILAAPVLAATALPLHFEPNRGQSATDVRYLARVRNATVYLTDSGIRVDGLPVSCSPRRQLLWDKALWW